MSAIRRTVELRAGQDHVLLPQGLFRIDRRERPLRDGWYAIEYDPCDQFITVVGPSDENVPGTEARA
jgi:hypothetical protein